MPAVLKPYPIMQGKLIYLCCVSKISLLVEVDNIFNFSILIICKTREFIDRIH